MSTTKSQSNKNSKYHKINRRFTKEEDEKLKELVLKYGEQNWLIVSSRMHTRNSRQCKDRWFQYLSPNANLVPWTLEEEIYLKCLVVELNGRWSEIAKRFPGRSDSQVRNKWRTLQRRLGCINLDLQDYIKIAKAEKQINQTPIQENTEPDTLKPNESCTFMDTGDLFNFNCFEDDTNWICNEFEQFTIA